MTQLDVDQRSALKNKRFVLLRNEEDLDADATRDLAVIKEHFKELADLHMMKESLRSIYRVVDNPLEAELAFNVGKINEGFIDDKADLTLLTPFCQSQEVVKTDVVP